MQAPSEQGFELRGETAPLLGIVRNVWRSRELIRILSRKDFFVTYRRASLGVFWSVGLPLVQATVLSVVLSRIVRFRPPGGIPFPVFVYSGILPWQFFSNAVTSGVSSITNGSGLATKIYFPRSILTTVNVLSGFYAFVPGVIVLVVMSLILGVDVNARVVLIVPALALMLLLSLGFGLVLGAIQVYLRDTKHVVAALTLPWFWGSGIFYPLERLGKGLRTFIDKNPAAGMIQLFRAAVGGASRHWETTVWWSVVWVVVLFVIAGLLHRRFDRVFVDRL